MIMKRTIQLILNSGAVESCRISTAHMITMALLHEEDKGKKVANKEEPQNKKAWPKKEKQKKDEKSEDKKEKKCFTCGSSTHLNKDCRKRKGTCFNCGEMGRFTRDCPKK